MKSLALSVVLFTAVVFGLVLFAAPVSASELPVILQARFDSQATDEINLLSPATCPPLLSCKTGRRYRGNTRA